MTLWTVFRRSPATSSPGAYRSSDAQEATEHFAALVADATGSADVSLRGVYDVSGLRSDADLMVWLTGDHPERLQRVLRDIRREPLLQQTAVAWSAMGVHRGAEFAKEHIPSFMRPELEPRQWLCVYPFVRSYEWYLLPDDERRAMLQEHGLMGRDHPQVLANTVSSFALGDWEWILGLEADELVDLVDLMRHLRGAQARRHVRAEIPFYTGRRIDFSEIAEVLL